MNRLMEEEARLLAAYQLRETATSDRYSWFNKAHLWLMQMRESDTMKVLRGAWPAGLQGVRILDVGCGSGFWMREFVRWGADPANVHGIDLLRSRVADARLRCAPSSGAAIANAARLPFADGTFDLVHQAVVFTSILSEEVRFLVARELVRVTAARGIILWYDFHVDNPANPDVRRVTRRDLDSLFQGAAVEFRRVGLAPPIARVLAPHSGWACELLRAVPWLCTHHLAVIRPDVRGT